MYFISRDNLCVVWSRIVIISLHLSDYINRSTPPNYDEWLITKSKQKAQRVKKIQEELDLEAEEKRKKEVEKQIRARDAFEKWVRVRAPNQRKFNLFST